MVWLFLAFPFGCWGIDSRRRGRGTIFFTFRFAFSFAWSLTLSFLALAFTFAFTFAFGNVRVGRIVVSNIPVFIWVSSDPWGTKRSSARGTYRCNPRLLYPRGMTIGYECWEKGICVPARGATARGGVRDRDLNMWEGGESSGDRVGDRSAGSIRRRDRDTRRVRERGGGWGCGDVGSGGAGGGGGPHGGGWRGICATSTLARLDARNCWMAVCKA